jgi:hypothetical protein
MNTAIVTTTAATVSAFIQNLQQQHQQKPQTSKEAIAANVKALIEQLEEGHSEGLTAYLMAMGRFHNYSFGNILEIARQKPSATRVAGMYAWNQLGRRVNKGEKGIRILAPMTGVRRKKDICLRLRSCKRQFTFWRTMSFTPRAILPAQFITWNQAARS